jgi:hypothetical protein
MGLWTPEHSSPAALLLCLAVQVTRCGLFVNGGFPRPAIRYFPDTEISGGAPSTWLFVANVPISFADREGCRTVRRGRSNLRHR